MKKEGETIDQGRRWPQFRAASRENNAMRGEKQAVLEEKMPE